MSQATQTETTAQELLLDGRDVAMLPWQAFAGGAGLRDRVLWRDPAGRTYAGLLPTPDQPAWTATGIGGG